MLALIPALLSIGAIYALIPVIVIVILIAAAAGLRGVDTIFGVFGFSALASFVGGKGGIGGGKAGKGIAGAKYKADTKTLKSAAGKMGKDARKARQEKQTGAFDKAADTLKSAGYQTTKTASILAQERQNSVMEVAKSWNSKGMQTNPTKTLMAVNKEIQARYRRGLRGQKLVQKNLSLKERAVGKVLSARDVGINTLGQSGLTASAAAALENKMYPAMQDHNAAMLARKSDIYKEKNATLEKIFTDHTTAYNALSATDNWSERIVGKRIVNEFLTPKPPKAPVQDLAVGLTGEPAKVGGGASAQSTQSVFQLWANAQKSEFRKATNFSWP